MHRIGSAAAGALAVLVLAIAPTGAVLQLASYTNGDNYNSKTPALISAAPNLPLSVFSSADVYIANNNRISTPAYVSQSVLTESVTEFTGENIPLVSNDIFSDEHAYMTGLHDYSDADAYVLEDETAYEDEHTHIMHMSFSGLADPEDNNNVAEEIFTSSISVIAVGNAFDVIPLESPESTGTYIWPANGNLSSRFGPRDSTVGSSNHQGIDISGSSGNPILAADGGEVIFSGRSNSYGNVVNILHDNGDITIYAHCSELFVREGDMVSQGQVIAGKGRTGVATGVHLHFELIINGVNVDPLRYLP